jgi:hypothetical protein
VKAVTKEARNPMQRVPHHMAHLLMHRTSEKKHGMRERATDLAAPLEEM